jgi:hypothetical protein
MKSNFDFDRIWESKRVFRKRLAAAPIAEKLRMLDALRERALVLRSARSHHTVREEAPGYGAQPRPERDS